jgi:hypothetical protein
VEEAGAVVVGIADSGSEDSAVVVLAVVVLAEEVAALAAAAHPEGGERVRCRLFFPRHTPAINLTEDQHKGPV